MSTPKELADKAKQQAHDYALGTSWPLFAKRALHATIDQLQAMAEARQGSGEPVAYLRVHTRDGGIWGYTQEEPTTEEQELAKLDGNELRPVVYQATPSVQQASEPVAWVTPGGDLHWAHAKTPPYPDWTPLYTAPPSAQQATGSGQVLTDGFSYTASKQLVTVTKEWCRGWDACRAALAAATQAQPESREQRLATAMKRFDEHGPLPGMISAFEQQFGQTWTDREWRQEASIWSAAWRAALAAPTTGKREPLSDEQRTELARSFTGRNVPAIASPELWFQRGISAAERAHGITGEQR